MEKDVEAFLNFRFEKIKLLKTVTGKKEIWLVKIKSTGEKAIMKIIAQVDENYFPPPYTALKKFSHPILAKIFYCTSDGSVCVEEFVEGKTFREFIDEQKFFDENSAKDFLLQLCDGLKILHENNIIHRDIKPENLILQDSGQIKLIDFDVARIFKDYKTRDTKNFGTYGYAAPEQFGHGQTDARSDIYALGQTLKEILGKNYRGSLEKILEKCTEFDPKRRFQNVDELKDALLNNKILAENIADYRAVENFKVPQKIEIAEKKSYGKIFVICASMIFAAGIFYFNSTVEEKIPAENSIREEKISEPEENENIEEKINKPTFENITLPPLPEPPANQKITPQQMNPQQVTPQITLPENFTPSFPNQNTTLSNFEPSYPNQKNEKNFVRAKYFWNGAQINDWQNKLDEDAEIAHVIHIPAEIWENNSTPINGTLEITLENYSAENFTPQLEIIFDDDGNLQTKTLSGQILNSGQNYTFRVPLNEFRVDSLKNVSIGSAEMRIKIFGDAQVIGSNATIMFMFVQKGFPIPQN